MSEGVKSAISLLEQSELSLEERTALTSAILGKLNALPIKDIIKYEGNTLYLNNEPVGLEMAKVLREGARTMLGNSARKAVEDQVLFQAITIGVHKGELPEQIIFSRSAIWSLQEMNKLYTQLAQIG